MLDQARELAARIMGTWAGGPTAEVWTDALAKLEYGTANTAYVRLRRELERAPSIHRFLERYRSLHTAETDPIRVDCPHCEGSGWVDRIEHGPGCPRRKGAQSCACNAVVPCSCEAGREYDDTYTAIGKANRWAEAKRAAKAVAVQREMF